MSDFEKLTTLERLLISWDKDDRILYAAARQCVRQGGKGIEAVALEYDVDIYQLCEVVAELVEHEKALQELDK